MGCGLWVFGCGDDGSSSGVDSGEVVVDGGPEGDAGPGNDGGGATEDGGPIPTTEECNGLDDDLDGLTDEEDDGALCGLAETCTAGVCVASGTVGWDATYGGATADSAFAVTMDETGNVFITGQFSGTVDFGGGERTALGFWDGFVLGLGPDGTYRWDRAFGGEFSSARGTSITVDGSGNVAVTGNFNNAVDFGGGPRTGAGGRQAFVLSLSPDGAFRWDRTFGAAGHDEGRAIATDSSGNVWVTGQFEGSLDFGGGMRSAVRRVDAFLLGLGPDGAYVRDVTFGGNNIDVGLSIAVDAAGAVLVGGSFGQSVDFGGGTRRSAGREDGFVVSFSSDGSHQWDYAAGGPGDDAINGVGVAGSGNAIVAGSFSGTVDFGGGERTSVSAASGFVVSLGPDGTYSADAILQGDSRPHALDLDASDHVYLTGLFRGTLGFGGGDRTSVGTSSDVFVVALGSDLGYRWDLTVGGPSEDVGYSIAVGDSNLTVAGSFEDVVDFGAGDRTSAGVQDIFVISTSR